MKIHNCQCLKIETYLHQRTFSYFNAPLAFHLPSCSPSPPTPPPPPPPPHTPLLFVVYIYTLPQKTMYMLDVSSHIYEAVKPQVECAN